MSFQEFQSGSRQKLRTFLNNHSPFDTWRHLFLSPLFVIYYTVCISFEVHI
ncbi:hypothetical protein Hanom_Chr04g00296791 [Helianthus anomalus]